MFLVMWEQVKMSPAIYRPFSEMPALVSLPVSHEWLEDESEEASAVAA